MKKMFYYGVKVHITGWKQAKLLPIPEFITISPAKTHDLPAQKRVYRQIGHLTLIADKAYRAKWLGQQFEQQGGHLLVPHHTAPRAPKQVKQRDSAYAVAKQRLVGKARQSIETFFAWLVEHTRIEQASRVRSYEGLLTHVYGKIAATIMAQKIIMPSFSS